MKMPVLFVALAVLSAGCSSYTEIGRPVTSVRTDDAEQPIAAISVFNTSYSIFGLIPLSSGQTWQTGKYEDRPGWNVTWFEDRCTLDENLASVRHALDEIGSHRIVNLTTESDSWRFWSLFILKRTIMKSTCTVLK